MFFRLPTPSLCANPLRDFKEKRSPMTAGTAVIGDRFSLKSLNGFAQSDGVGNRKNIRWQSLGGYKQHNREDNDVACYSTDYPPHVLPAVSEMAPISGYKYACR